jgi:hypothetical protein
LALQRRREREPEAGSHRAVDGRNSSASLAKRAATGVFWGYFGIAVSVLLFQAAQDYRFGRSVARARRCIVRLDSTCVSRELEVESSIRSADPRMELTAASLSLLLHRPSAPAQATADRLEAAQNAATTATPAELRSDVLLLRTDIAIANADLKRARDSVEAARTLLGESELTVLRLRRIESLEREFAARTTNGVESLRQSFERLLEAAAAGNRALIEVRQAACNDWIGRVADAGARRHLLLASQAAGRASLARYAEPSLGSYSMASSEPPPLPSKGTRYDTTYGQGAFEERMQRYRERSARYEKEQAAIRERNSLRASEASATKQAALDQAKEALAAGIAALSTAPAPFIDSLSPDQSAVARSRSLGQ